MTWEKVPEELCQNSWTHCGYKYKAQSELGRGGEIVHHSEGVTMQLLDLVTKNKLVQSTQQNLRTMTLMKRPMTMTTRTSETRKKS